MESRGATSAKAAETAALATRQRKPAGSVVVDVLREGWADAEALRVLRQQVAQEVAQAVATVQREPPPDPYKENWCALCSSHLIDVFEVPSLAPPP